MIKGGLSINKLGLKAKYNFSTKFINLWIIILLLTNIIITTTPIYADPLKSRTGSEGNQPGTGFSAGTEFFEIYHTNDVHDTSYFTGETVNIRLNSSLVDWAAGGGGRRNEWELFDYYGNSMDNGQFMQQPGGPPYIYTASFTAPMIADHYLVFVHVRESSEQGGSEIRTLDVIIVGGGATPSKHIVTYGTSAMITPKWVFGNAEIIYTSLYAPNTIDTVNSDVIFSDMLGKNDRIAIENLADPTIIIIGSDAAIAFDLTADLDLTQLPDNELKAGHWYTIGFDLQDDIGGQMASDWAAQIKILPSPQINFTDCVPNTINIEGTDSTTIFTEFYDEDAIDNNEFIVTFKVRDPNNTEITLVDNQTNGNGGLTVTPLGIANWYNASYTWNPADTATPGDYDLYARIYDGMNGVDIDGFNNNLDELEIYSTGNPPQITIGDTACIPSSVDKIGTPTGLIWCEFTDADNPAASSFYVSFKVRPPSNNNQDVITLVDNKANGGAAEVGGTVSVQLSGTKYTASYTWDPDDFVEVGNYDLYFMVTDELNNSAEDPFAQNLDELEIIISVEPPTITAGNMNCLPSSVNKLGTGTTTIYCEFTDSKYTSVDDFNVTFKVRDPSNNEIVLVDNKPNGVDGVEITYSGTIFNAWYEWDPPSSVVVGDYDLYFGVKNRAGGYAEDGFTNNSDELTIVTSVEPPTITAGNMNCLPSSVNKLGTGTTTIYCEFTDSKYTSVDDFNVTFIVRDPLGTEIVLVDDKTTGVDGALIEYSGTVFIASYKWDPPTSVEPGDYDLYFGVMNRGGGFAEDGFTNNPDELTIVTSGNVPVITDVNCVPSSISVKGTETTQIFAEFTDADNPTATSLTVTFKVRNPDAQELVFVSDKPDGGTAETGGNVKVEVYGIGYKASYYWDPLDDIKPGKYDLYFSVKDETLAEAVDGFNNNIDKLELTGDFTGPGTPNLELDKLTHQNNNYKFSIIYTDAENNPPNNNGVLLIIGANTYEMIAEDLSDNDYTDGNKYYYIIKLGERDYVYYLKVTDSENNQYQTGNYDLTVEFDEESQEKKPNDTLLFIGIILVIIVIIILSIVIALTRKSHEKKTFMIAKEEIIKLRTQIQEMKKLGIDTSIEEKQLKEVEELIKK